MKQTQTLRPDKTGKALLTVLRHLSRLHEVWPSSMPAVMSLQCTADPWHAPPSCKQRSLWQDKAV